MAIAYPTNIIPDVTIEYKVEGKWQKYRTTVIYRFLDYLLKEKVDRNGKLIPALKVAEYLPQIGKDPFFLVAATGLGKTVGIPVHVLVQQLKSYFARAQRGSRTNDIPRVWVIEPRIPIAVSQMYFMNRIFAEFIQDQTNVRVDGTPALFGSITSATKRIHPNAPVMFVTTGILGILAMQGQLRSGKDRVIIDEAHVTIEQNADVELAISICRQLGVQVDYMSATVDTSNITQTLGVTSIIRADKRQYPIWMHNTGKPMKECIVDIVQNTLVTPNPQSEYFPKQDYADYDEVMAAVMDPTPRAKGMLFVVNSFSGKRSDVAKLSQLLEGAPFNANGKRVHVLTLASEVLRDPVRRARFDEDLDRIVASKGLYVLLATSVVEMGVTFETLEFMATMDTGYENETVEGTTFPRQTFLGVNALLQRVGRVGRKKAGIAYITREAGAPYASLSDTELNAGSLKFEPIQFPLSKGSLTQLAMYSFLQSWKNPIEDLKRLNLPSGIHNNEVLVQAFMQERKRLQKLGISDTTSVSTLGKQMPKWLGMTDLAVALNIQKALLRKDMAELTFWIVQAALVSVSWGDLVEKEQTVTLPGLTTTSEPVAMYQIMMHFLQKYGDALLETSFEKDSVTDAIIRESGALGINGEAVKAIASKIVATVQLLSDINRRTPVFQELFGQVRTLSLGDVFLPNMAQLSLDTMSTRIDTLEGKVQIEVTVQADNEKQITWTEVGGPRTGTLRADACLFDITGDVEYTANLIPFPVKESKQVQWRAIHLQPVEEQVDEYDEEYYDEDHEEEDSEAYFSEYDPRRRACRELEVKQQREPFIPTCWADSYEPLLDFRPLHDIAEMNRNREKRRWE